MPGRALRKNTLTRLKDLQDRRFHRQLLQELEFLKEVFEAERVRLGIGAFSGWLVYRS